MTIVEKETNLLGRGAKLWEHGSGAPEMQFCDLVFWDAF